MRVGQSRRRDANERAICEALEAIGVRILRISEPGCPDLLAWTAREGFRLLEVKQKTGKLTALQQQTQIPFTVIRSVEEALRIYGVSA